MLATCPPLFCITKIGVSEDVGATMVSSEMPKILFGPCSDLFEIVDFENFWFGLLVKITRTFFSFEGFDCLCRFLGGHVKDTENCSFGLGGAFMCVWLSCENGQDTHSNNFALMHFEKGQNVNILFV